MNFLSQPKQTTLGTISKLGDDLFMINKEQRQEMRDETNKKIDKRVASGKGDTLDQKQDIVAPKIDNNWLKEI